MIPELLGGLPFKFFAASSIDALIHAVESSLSPKGNEMTRLFGYKAIEMILNGYKIIAEKGEEARIPLLSDFLTASNYAGIAFDCSQSVLKNITVKSTSALSSYKSGAASVEENVRFEQIA